MFSPFGMKGVEPSLTSKNLRHRTHRYTSTDTINVNRISLSSDARTTETHRAGMLSILLSAASALGSVIKHH